MALGRRWKPCKSKAPTYGMFFDLPGVDIYTIKLHVERPAPAPAADLEFKYDHRR
jgi:hypothetical protein